MLDKYNQALNYDPSGCCCCSFKNENLKIKSKSKIKMFLIQ